MIDHLVMYSGGICSFLSAKRVVERHPDENIVLLFADTLIEDEDLYRFVDQTVEYLGVEFVRLCEGRTPWEVCNDELIIANSRIDPCSKILKRELLNKWRDQHCDPAHTTIHFGLDWTETHRLERLRKRDDRWDFQAYMTDPPLLGKHEMIKEVEELGIQAPRLYHLGFNHNNCGGFCYKAGQAQFRRLLEVFPDRYREHEEAEEKLADKLEERHNRRHSILRRQRDGTREYISLKQFREEIEADKGLFDENDWGGCGCAVD